MKYLFVLFLTIQFLKVNAQLAEYSNRTTRLTATDEVIIVPEVATMNHLLVTTPGKDIKLQVYNKDLQWQFEKVFPFALSEKSEITVIPFSNEYYLYDQSKTESQSYLWRIDAQGNTVDESKKLKAIINSSFKDTNVTCQLFSYKSSIFLLGNQYFPTLKKIVTTIIQTNSRLEQTVVKRYATNFDHLTETLQRIVVVPNRDLLILKRLVTEDRENILEVLKVKLQTGKTYVASYNSHTPFSYPDVVYNSADSSTTVIAQLPRSFFANKYYRNLFSATLSDTLNEQIAPTLTKVVIGVDMNGAFTCINAGNGSKKWLAIHGNWNLLYNPQTTSRLIFGAAGMVSIPKNNTTTILNATSYQPKLQVISPYIQLVDEPGDVRFTSINNTYKSVQDTTIKYHRRNFIEVGQYSTFTKDNTNFLVVKEQFPSRGKGLLLFYLDKQDKLVSTPLRLYERYHYSLPQLQQTHNGNVMFPFVYRNEVGLASITLDNIE